MFITVGDLALLGMLCLSIIVSVFLVIALIKISCLVKKATRIIDKNKDNIDKTITVLPEAVTSLKDALDKTGSVIGTIDSAVTDRKAVKVSNTAEGIFEGIKIVGSIAKYIKGFLDREEKD